MTYLIALASAALYGAADFIGGLASRRAATVAIVALSQASGLVLLAVGVPLLPAASWVRADLAWGAAAGLAGGIGVALLYRALAVGTMALVAPVTAVCAVAIPVAAGLLAGERPGPVTLLGMALALLAIVLVSQTPAEGGAPSPRPGDPRSHPRSGLRLAFVAGVAIGLFFLALARTGPDAGLWPLLAARVTSVGFFLIAAAVAGTSLRMSRDVALWAVAGGALDMLANTLYLIAAREGPLSVVVTLASLYPASTVVLARVFLDERLSRVQTAGILCALAAVVLIVGSG